MTETDTSISMSQTTFSSIQSRYVAENMVPRITAIHRSLNPPRIGCSETTVMVHLQMCRNRRESVAMPGRGLGVACLDLTGDGWADFYVANDGEANQLWVNQKDGTFTEEAILYGLAFNAYGQPEGSMGIAVGDVNGDTRPDLFVTHLSGETNTLYVASTYAVFVDMTEMVGFAGRDLPVTGFGCGFVDFDNDADLDIALVNGRVKRGAVLEGASTGEFWNFYAEPNLLLKILRQTL